jgi:hypothetical protein
LADGFTRSRVEPNELVDLGAAHPSAGQRSRDGVRVLTKQADVDHDGANGSVDAYNPQTGGR